MSAFPAQVNRPPTAVSPTPQPDATSSAYDRMAPTWRRISDILQGEDVIRAATIAYLPSYPKEKKTEYERRLQSTIWQPEFEDALNNISSRPFSQDVIIKTKSPPSRITDLIENIDTEGNSLTQFAHKAFYTGIAYGMHAIFIDMPPPPLRPTLLSDRQSNPYWVHIDAPSLLAVYTTTINGQEVVLHARFWETSTSVINFEEVTVSRIRVLDLTIAGPTWELWEQRETTTAAGLKEQAWQRVDGGFFKGVKNIPLVLWFSGKRIGPQEVIPPLKNLAAMQIDLYRAQSRQEEIETFAGSPMLSANGFSLPEGESIDVGPRAVLMAPPGVDGQATSWTFVEPSAQNIAEIRKGIQEKIDNMRRLGLQPMTQRSGYPTATGQNAENSKSHTQVQQWATTLNDAIERAFQFTNEYLGLPDTLETEISTDFYVVPYSQPPLDALTKARERGDISQHTFWNGLKRFDVLPADFDGEAETVLLAEEGTDATLNGPPLDPRGNTADPNNPPPN